jgi:hypothetical protein
MRADRRFLVGAVLAAILLALPSLFSPLLEDDVVKPDIMALRTGNCRG